MDDSKAVTATYEGLCWECGLPWAPGDLIRITTAVEDGSRSWRHATCPVVAREDNHPACVHCWLVHPEGACDRDPR